MEGLKGRFFYTLAGSLSALSSLVALPGCQTGACASCFGCAGMGACILLIASFKKTGREKGEKWNG